MNKYIKEILTYEAANKDKPFDLALIPEDIREYVIQMLRKEYEKKLRILGIILYSLFFLLQLF